MKNKKFKYRCKIEQCNTPCKLELMEGLTPDLPTKCPWGSRPKWKEVK